MMASNGQPVGWLRGGVGRRAKAEIGRENGRRGGAGRREVWRTRQLCSDELTAVAANLLKWRVALPTAGREIVVLPQAR